MGAGFLLVVQGFNQFLTKIVFVSDNRLGCFLEI